MEARLHGGSSSCRPCAVHRRAKKRPQPGAGWGRSSQYVMCRTAGNGTATQFRVAPIVPWPRPLSFADVCSCSISGTPRSLSSLSHISDGTKCRVARDVFCGHGHYGESRVVGRSYLTRQAATLLKFAKSTQNPELAAVLIERAADLKSQVDDTMPLTDQSPVAPDVEPVDQSTRS